MTTTKKRTLNFIINNLVLTESINKCDFYLKYNQEKFILSDGFIEELNIPELNTFSEGTNILMNIENKNINNNKSFLKKITIRNVSKSILFDKKPDSDNGALGEIFSLVENPGWCFKANEEGEIIFEKTFEENKNVTKSNIKIKDTVDFSALKDTSANPMYYLSYTIQYYFKANTSNNTPPKICVFDPLIRVTNGDRR